ncbi:hypothetical protein PAMP_009823 [Pampus punctatissimus]
MYESVDVEGLSPSPSSPSPGSFLSMDYYHRPPGLGPEKGLLSGVGGLQRPFGGSLVTGRHWSGSSHLYQHPPALIYQTEPFLSSSSVLLTSCTVITSLC